MPPPKLFDFTLLFAELSAASAGEWPEQLRQRTAAALTVAGHGNLAQWIETWHALPDILPDAADTSASRVAACGDIPSAQRTALEAALRVFHPWRKGPFDLFGIPVESEWRSDWKWNRLKDHVEWRNRRVLDVGCGNGYFGWRMLSAGAELVLGLDPFLLYVMQHETVKRYVGPDAPNFVLPLADDCIPARLKLFDVTLSMGVLYHRTSPIDHLQTLHNSLRGGGQLVLETLILKGDEQQVLVPEQRYAKMRNVWFIPTLPMLQLWLRRAGFREIVAVDVSVTSTEEQRSTDWMTFESLSDFLDPADNSKTIEGYPAPVRALLTARA